MLNILITGANRGIGFKLTKQLCRKHFVHAICRQPSKDLLKLSNVNIIDHVDLSDIASIRHAIELLPDHIDILINNAGILKRVILDVMGDDDLEFIRQQFNINALAPLFMVNQCLPKFKSGSKVILMTSRMGSITDNDSGSHYGYRMSKAALNMAGKSMAIDLKPFGISVGIIHPGWVQTDMTGQTGHLTPKQSAAQIIDRIHALDISNSGTFWHSDGTTLDW